jgi:hypothetical protein
MRVGIRRVELNPIVGLVAEFGGYANTKAGIDDRLMTYMFSPRFNWWHALAASTPHTGFAVSFSVARTSG